MNVFKMGLFLILAGCASVKSMRGQEAQLMNGPAKPGVKISAVYDSELSQEGYHLIRIYFLNMADHWQRIKNIQVSEVSSLDDFHLISGGDFKTWKQSMGLDYELKVEKAKRDKTDPPKKDIKAELSKLTKENFLLSPLSLPGKLQSERWVLIQTPGKTKIREVVLRLNYVDSTEVVYKLFVEGHSL